MPGTGTAYFKGTNADLSEPTNAQASVRSLQAYCSQKYRKCYNLHQVPSTSETHIISASCESPHLLAYSPAASLSLLLVP